MNSWIVSLTLLSLTLPQGLTPLQGLIPPLFRAQQRKSLTIAQIPRANLGEWEAVLNQGEWEGKVGEWEGKVGEWEGNLGEWEVIPGLGE